MECKINSKFNKKSERLNEVYADLMQYSADIGSAHSLALILFMMDNKWSEKEIREYLNKALNALNADALEYHMEVKTNLYK